MPPLLASDAFDTDPWTFSGDGFSFEATSIKYFDAAPSVQAHALWRGALGVPIPTMPLVSGIALGATLVYLFARALRRSH